MPKQNSLEQVLAGLAHLYGARIKEVQKIRDDSDRARLEYHQFLSSKSERQTYEADKPEGFLPFASYEVLLGHETLRTKVCSRDNQWLRDQPHYDLGYPSSAKSGLQQNFPHRILHRRVFVSWRLRYRQSI